MTELLPGEGGERTGCGREGGGEGRVERERGRNGRGRGGQGKEIQQFIVSETKEDVYMR